MKFKSEFSNVLKLFLLSTLFFWSCTWNLSEDLDLSGAETGKQTKPEDIDYVGNDVLSLDYQRSVITGSFSCGPGRLDGCESTSSIPIPSFDEWKKKEMIKHDKGPWKDGSFHPNRRLNRRKLNYASSKCGAKILSSNPEARHRTAVLSEKSDEYMLNPCRVDKTWFVVELCDTVEATQIELANYELYSSSPREFSVFWSETYPAVVWHPLGTFEAKDQRTMQTFELTVKNLGKFVKVVVYNHHGKEHYCPLSVVRVLGYSMVQNLEDIEAEENSPDSTSDNRAESRSKMKDRSKEESQESVVREFKNAKSNLFSVKFCAVFFKHCSGAASKKLRLDRPTCLFFEKVLKSRTNCCKVFCSGTCEALSSTTDSSRDKVSDTSSNPTSSEFEKSWNGNGTDGASENNAPNHRDIVKDYERTKSLVKESTDFSLDKSVEKSGDFKSIRWNSSIDDIRRTVENRSSVAAEAVSIKPTDPFRGKESDDPEKCLCEKKTVGTISNEVTSGEEVTQEKYENGDTIDSAGLIQKESVLFKLTARIKASETNLSLINKYLQQLSHYYRFQMEDMKTLFNHTVHVIGTASEKARDININQEKSITALEEKMRVLNRKIDYLMSGQRDLLKRAIELHGFFVILEFIIVSTIFTIFLNIFRRKNALAEKRDPKLTFCNQ